MGNVAVGGWAAGPPGVPGPSAIGPGYGAAMVPELDVHRVLRWAPGHNYPDHLHELRIEVDVSPTLDHRD